MKCPKCESGEHTYNSWIPNNEKLIEFIRWRELRAALIFSVIGYIILGIIGIIGGWLFYYLMGTIGGGAVCNWYGDYKQEPLKIKQGKCLQGHKNCPYTAIRLN